MNRWNGISILWGLQRHAADLSMYTDASRLWGCKAFGFQPLPIAAKELIPVIPAAAMWGKHWTGKIVLFKVDNIAIVEAINATFCKDLHLMHLIRMLVFFATYHNFWFQAAHIAEKDKLADELAEGEECHC